MNNSLTSLWGQWKAEIILLISCLLGIFMIGNQSIWSDEACTAIYALQPDFNAFKTFLKTDGGGDPLMLMSVSSIWAWGKLIGTDEWTLRALNLVWGTAAMLAFYLTGKKVQMPWLPLLAAIQPYFWYYIGELRPYAGQMAIGAWLLYSFVSILIDRAITIETWAILAISCTLLYFSSLLAPIILLPILFILAVIAWKLRFSVSRPPVFLFLILSAFWAAVSWHYFETIRRGASGVLHWPVTPLNLAYVGYELAGAFGLGPPLPVIRELYFERQLGSAIKTYLAGSLLVVLLASTLIYLLVKGSQLLFRQKRLTLPLAALAVPVASVFLFYIFGLVSGKAFWGRHLAAAFPFYLLTLSFLLAVVWQKKGLLGRGACFLFVILICLASMRSRWSPAYEKEDIRKAAEIAATYLSAGKTVLFGSEWRGAIYYGLIPISNTGQNPRLITNGDYLYEADPSPVPDVVIFSNRQFFRQKPALEKALADLGIHESSRFGTFIIYTKPTPPDVSR